MMTASSSDTITQSTDLPFCKDFLSRLGYSIRAQQHFPSVLSSNQGPSQATSSDIDDTAQSANLWPEWEQDQDPDKYVKCVRGLEIALVFAIADNSSQVQYVRDIYVQFIAFLYDYGVVTDNINTDTDTDLGMLTSFGKELKEFVNSDPNDIASCLDDIINCRLEHASPVQWSVIEGIVDNNSLKILQDWVEACNRLPDLLRTIAYVGFQMT